MVLQQLSRAHVPWPCKSDVENIWLWWSSERCCVLHSTKKNKKKDRSRDIMNHVIIYLDWSASSLASSGLSPSSINRKKKKKTLKCLSYFHEWSNNKLLMVIGKLATLVTSVQESTNDIKWTVVTTLLSYHSHNGRTGNTVTIRTSSSLTLQRNAQDALIHSQNYYNH